MSAHSQMRRTILFALLLLTVPAVSSAGSVDQPAQAHRKASAAAHHALLSSSPQRTHTSYRTTARYTRPHTAARAAIRTVKYTPAFADERIGGSTGYEAAYKSGYEAGRAAALKQLAGENVDVKLNGRPSAPLPAGESSLKTYQPGTAQQPAGEDVADEPAPDAAAGQTAAARGIHRTADSPAAERTIHAADSTETSETTDTLAPTETASLHFGGAEMPASLRGSLASLERQNTRLDAEGLERIEDESDLASRIDHKLLVPLPASAALTVNPNLIENHRYCRPWTERFVADLARAHEAVFHRPIEVNSAVRTVEYQKRLRTTNGNAAPAEGDIVSPHLTGATIDIAKEGLSRQEMAWMRRQLLGLEEAGKIDVEEEFEQACFHITVYKSYAPARHVHTAGQTVTGQAPATRHKAAQPAAKHPGSQLPADLAVGMFAPQGR